ncbi:MAG: hypothetical protein AAB573_01475 [Patescibacteria group bacterium]
MQQNAEFVHGHNLVLLDKQRTERGMFRMIRRDSAGTYMPIELACVWPQSDVCKPDFSKTRIGQIMAGISWGRNRRTAAPQK